MPHDVKFGFKARNETAIAAAENNAARMVKNVSDETRRAIRGIVVRSIRDGIPPRDAAKMIRGSIGMDSRQTAGASNYRAELRTSGLSEERIDKAYEFYTAKKIRQRATRIARTEVMGALNAGSLESWKQAQRDGLLPANAKKKWIVTKDDALCPVCRPMKEQEQSFGKKFILPNGKKVMFPPAHPDCRCTMGDPSAFKARKEMYNFVRGFLPPLARKLKEVNILAPDDFMDGGVADPFTRFGEKYYQSNNFGFTNMRRAYVQMDSMLRAGRMLEKTGYLLSEKIGLMPHPAWEPALFAEAMWGAKPIRTIVTNLSSPAWSYRPRLRALDVVGSPIIAKMKEHGPEYILLHEYGHMSWGLDKSDFWGGTETDWNSRPLTEALERLGTNPPMARLRATMEVSPYAGTNLQEFVAEVFARNVISKFVYGKSVLSEWSPLNLPRLLAELYDWVGGPKL